MTLGFVVSMYDELNCVAMNLARLGSQFERIAIVQSQEEPYPKIVELTAALPASYILLPNLDTRTPEEKTENSERFDVCNKSMARNFSAGFRAMDPCPDYVLAATGDTLFLNLFGIEWIIGQMERGNYQVGCSRAMGQDLHAAHWTREQMADKTLPKGGRLQTEHNHDFMPHMWIVRADVAPRFRDIQVTNPWSFEQCLGDAMGDAEQFVFAKNAYDFSDGVIYNTPSPENWKH